MSPPTKKSLGARTLVFPAPAWVIGSYDRQGKPNVMTAAWGGICCSKPPCVGVALRRATYTYGNLVDKRAFTVNVPSEKHLKETDYFGLVSGRNTDKFAATGLTPLGSDLVDAPYLAEFPLVLECRVRHVNDLGLHTLFVGEIMDVKADESVLDDQGLPVVDKVRPIVYGPEVRTYHGVGPVLGRAFSAGRDLT
ncbi:MAG: flavin reductase family protein [Proteobacteria bacterium]|nr:flavin reductase family protein [Pseudomonadota bacterium]MBU1740073.1 flavin reductase family protein [Pseudomonadota bacterium]